MGKEDFYKELFSLYKELSKRLLAKDQGYYGMLVKQALKQLEAFIEEKDRYFIFIGINSLAKGEQELIKQLALLKRAEIYCDIDAYYFKDPLAEAGFFVREYLKYFSFLKEGSLRWVENYFSNKKEIELLAIPGRLAQIKLAGNLLKETSSMEKIGLIFIDDTFKEGLFDFINRQGKNININIKYPFYHIPFSNFFSLIMELFIQRKKLGKDHFYYKDIIVLFKNPFFKLFLKDHHLDFIELIERRNLIFISDRLIQEHFSNEILLALFDPRNKKVIYFKENVKKIIKAFDSFFLKKTSSYKKELEFLSSLSLFIDFLENHFDFMASLSDIEALYEIYLHWLRTNYSYLSCLKEGSNIYLMGLFDACLMDFDRIILLSVNEGVLPPKKTQESFISIEVQKKFSLPTFKEKEAFYAYHFYRLLQRSQWIHFIYNSIIEPYSNGQISRFIYQLEIESSYHIKKKSFSPLFNIQSPMALEIKKSPDLIDKLKKLALKGFSPSTLALYIKNPLEFYYKKILNLREKDQISEKTKGTIFGQILHHTLKELYEPFINKILKEEHITWMEKKGKETLVKFFKYYDQRIDQGKNLLIFQVANKFIEEVLLWDKNALNKGDELIIYFIEKSFSAPIEIPSCSYPVFLTGQIDRIEKRNGIIHIIDYKSALVEPYELKLRSKEHLSALLYDIKYEKIVQLLIYGYLWFKYDNNSREISLGIISFRKIRNGFMNLSFYENAFISFEQIEDFLPFLKEKIKEILDPSFPIIEKIEAL